MNYVYQSVAFLTFLCIAPAMNASIILPRSQSVYTAREMVGIQSMIDPWDRDCGIYGTFYMVPGGGKTFKPNQLAFDLFGADARPLSKDENALVISGSRVTERGAHDWLADYFGLPTDYQSTVFLSPKITYTMADFSWYIGLDSCMEGIFIKLYAPIVRSVWHLNMDEKIINEGTASYVPGYFTPSPDGVPRSLLTSSFTDFVSDFAVPDIMSTSTFNTLSYAQLPTCKQHATYLADLRAIFGYHFLRCANYHFGLGFIIAAPTGNKVKAEYLFSPVVGNGHHWELGAQLTAHYTPWRSCDDSRSLGIYVDANITHLLNDCQMRTFDLCGKPNSKYMLAQKLGTISETPSLGGAANAGIEFQQEFTSVANLTTRSVDVSHAVQVDASAMLNYTGRHWTLDVGYNFWFRSHEKFKPTALSPKLDGTTWALKGDAAVIGFEATTNDAVRLAATESLATIHAGTNNFQGPSNTAGGLYSLAPTQNPGIDSPVLAVTTTATIVNDMPNSTRQTNSSATPILLTEADLDMNSSLTQSWTNGFFAHVSYAWDCHRRWVPYLGVGTEVEVAPAEAIADNKERNCGLSMWHIWIKGGIAF